MSDCQESLDKLYAYLDLELEPTTVAVIREHVGECPPCGNAFSFEERLLLVIRSGLREEMPPGLIDRLRAVIRAQV